MKLFYLFLFLFLDGVLGHNVFGKAILKDSELCRPWTNLNAKLFNGSDEPSADDVTFQLRTLLPAGDWQTVVRDVVSVCFGERPRVYTNTCPGQALLHCLLDNLISHCPESALAKDDACAPLSSLAGFKYMFSQSRYDNMEKYLPTERRPLWFLKNYFSSKCCDVPQLFSPQVLSEVGFTSMIHYYGHEPKPKGPHFVQETPAMVVTTEAHIASKVRVVEQSEPESDDPLDCCDISDFISPESRSACKFQTSWNERQRLVIADNQLEEVSTTTTTKKPDLKHHDVKVVPLSCEKESCVFKHLNIVTESGSVDTTAFSRLLDNFTHEHPEWMKAKARVVTRCLTRPVKDYDGDCEINKVLSCTFDVLSENCPHAKKPTVDPCKHTYSLKNDTICQINSSKFRPKNRRQYCDFPRFVNHEVLAACDVSSINQVEKAAPPVLPTARKTFGWWMFRPVQCNETKPVTNCLLSKMDVLTKYNFLDYFKMKDRIGRFTAKNVEWSNLREVYGATLTGMPMYRESCASQRKLLNVVDAMLMTCPVSKRKNTDKCNKMFSEMIKNAPENQQPKVKLTFGHNFMTGSKNFQSPQFGPPPLQFNRIPAEEHETHTDPDEIPPVKILHIKPQKMIAKGSESGVRVRTPLVVTPVYMGITTPTKSTPVTSTGIPREYLRTDSLYNPPFSYDGIFRSASVPRRVENGHKGPGNMFGFPNMP